MSGLIELTGLGDLLRLVGILFWVLVVGALIMALTLPKTRKDKAFAVLVVVGLFIAFPGRWAWEAKQQRDAVQARYQKAEAMFQERCKKSGEFIYRTAENVEGVFLLKIREGYNHYDQYKMDDPYGADTTGEGYLRNFLMARDEKGLFNVIKIGGYRYVDAIDSKDGKRYRYTGRLDEPWKWNPHALEGHRVFVFDKVLAPNPAPRYGVTYDDISTREERDYWIAGSSLKVIDLRANEVMAERIGYMMDRSQGNNSRRRALWLFAADYACPKFGPEKVGVSRSFYQFYQTRNFVEKILHTVPEK
jgi:hypothetical protein